MDPMNIPQVDQAEVDKFVTDTINTLLNLHPKQSCIAINRIVAGVRECRATEESAVLEDMGKLKAINGDLPQHSEAIFERKA